MELIYPFVIYICIPIIIFLIVIKLKKNDQYRDGKKIANTKYVKELSYYKEILKKYKILTYALKSVCIIAIILSMILLARPASVDVNSSPLYNRDIFVCMDVSTSVSELNFELVKILKETVKQLKGERFGITIFNTSSVLLVPLTDDYQYVLDTLDKIEDSLRQDISTNTNFFDYNIEDAHYLQSGTLEGNSTKGSSIISDALASCVYNFSNLEEDRSRSIIFSTDNDLAGTAMLTLQEAAEISKNKGIKVYAIAPDFIDKKDEAELKKAAETTGGRYYNETSFSTVSDIVENIQQQEKNLTEKKEEIIKIDKPQIPFIMLVISIIILFILNKKVKI